MYATLCVILSESLPPVGQKEFKRSLITYCQTEFTQRKEKLKIDPALEGEEKEDMEKLAKLRSLGTVKFIGELFKQNILAERTMHACISQMLEEMSPEDSGASEEDFQALVKFVSTTGALLEAPQQKYREDVKSYFKQFGALAARPSLPARVRFMIRDLIDLRDNGWVPRLKGNEAKTLAEARADVEDGTTAVTPLRKSGQHTNPNTPTGPSSGKGKRDTREKLSKSTGAIPRTAPTPAEDDWETAGSGKKKGKGKDAGNGWETVGGGGGREGRGGRGRGTPGRGGRGGHHKEEAPEKKALAPVRVNLFMALEEDEDTSSPPPTKSKRPLAQSEFIPKPAAETPIRKSVTIQEPKKARDVNNELRLIFEEYIVSRDKEEVLLCLQNLELSQEETSSVVHQSFRVAIENNDKMVELLRILLRDLVNEEILTEDDLIDGFSSLASTIEDDDLDFPMASKHLGSFIGQMVAADKLSLAFLKSALSPVVESGKAVKIAVVALQTVQKMEGPEKAAHLLEKSGLDLNRLVKRSEREGGYLNSLLQSHDLASFASQNRPAASADEELDRPARPRSQSVNSSAVDAIVLQQSAQGYWNLDQRFADLLNARQGDLSLSIPEMIKDRTEVWATLLAVEFLQNNFKSKSDQWALVVKKAWEWLEGQTTSHGQLQEDAQQCLKDLDLWTL